MNRERRGSAYVLVLAVAMLVTVIGLAGLAAGRVRLQTTVLEQDWQNSAVVAASAVDHAFVQIAGDPWWRMVNRDYEDVFGPEVPFGQGWMSWRYEDLVDIQLDDSIADPLRIHGRGRVGRSSRAFSVIAFPTGESLDVLRTAIHAGGDLDAQGLLDVRNGPASANGTLQCEQLLGDAEALNVADPNNVTGSVTSPAPAKPMPSVAIWQTYKILSTEIKYGDLLGGNLEDVVLSPGNNPYGSNELNGNGLYWIKASGAHGVTLQIRNCRIQGTLLVELGSNSNLEIMSNVSWHVAHPDYPALVVYTNNDNGTTVDITCAGELSEFDLGVNFNPTHTPYFGDADADTVDNYPASINGLIHVIRNTASPTSRTTIEATNRITGCIIADGDVRTLDGTTIRADPSLLSRPPLGYTTARSATNLLLNGDMESGLAAWTPFGGSTSLASDGDDHTGVKSIAVTNRSVGSEGVRQDVTSAIATGVPYAFDGWIKMSDAIEDAEIALMITSSGEGTVSFPMPVATIQKSWTRVTGVITPTWTGTLGSAKLQVKTSTTAQVFKIDDFALTPESGGPPLATIVAVPGTWRAESADP